MNIHLCPQHQAESDQRFKLVEQNNPSWSESDWMKWFDIEWKKSRSIINKHCLSEINDLPKISSGYLIA